MTSFLHLFQANTLLNVCVAYCSISSETDVHLKFTIITDVKFTTVNNC